MSYPPPWKLVVQENNTILAILSLGIRRTPTAGGEWTFCRSKGWSCWASGQSPGTRGEEAHFRLLGQPTHSHFALHRQVALARLPFSSFPLGSSMLEQCNCLCLAQLTTVLTALQSPL